MKYVVLILVFLQAISEKAISQDITGVWTGTLYNDTTRTYIPYEIAISEYKKKLSGYSHTTFFIDGIPNIGVKAIKVTKKRESIFIEDAGLLFNDYSVSPARGVHQYSTLSLSEHDSVMILSGSWKTNRTREYSSATGKLTLLKKRNYDTTKLIVQLKRLDLMRTLNFNTPTDPKNKSAVLQPVVLKNSEPAAELKSRKIETVQTVVVNSDSLVLTLYDNGEVDGDIVTVVMDGKVIWPNQMLSARAINKKIYIPSDRDSVKLIMYAENLGSIPPNTGLLVVRDGEKDYEIRFSGDLQKNAAIVLKRRKKTEGKLQR